MAQRTRDLRERQFGQLSVVRRESEVWATPEIWLCFCPHCNTYISVSERDLLDGRVVDCGTQK